MSTIRNMREEVFEVVVSFLLFVIKQHYKEILRDFHCSVNCATSGRVLLFFASKIMIRLRKINRQTEKLIHYEKRFIIAKQKSNLFFSDMLSVFPDSSHNKL